MSPETRKARLISITILVIVLFGVFPQAVWAGQVLDTDRELFPAPFDGYDLDNIYVFYDPSDEALTALAQGAEELLSYWIKDVRLIPVASFYDVAWYMLDEPWVAIYALRSGVDGVYFPDRNLTWPQFRDLLRQHRSTQHILGMGNTLSLEPFLDDEDTMVHHSASEQTDALVLVLYDVYAVKEMCEARANATASASGEEFRRAADDLERMTLKVYADNFNAVFQRTVDPIDPVGEVDPVAAEARRAAMWARHPPRIRDAAYKLTDDGDLVEVPVDQLPANFSPTIRLSTASEVGASDFILGEIPLLSGLRGPIGKIVDVLLSVLSGHGETILSIPSSAMESLRDVFETIQPLLGIVSDFDAESPLKSVITALANEFPFPDNLKTYLEPILKALFKLRGDLSSIVDVIKELLAGLLPQLIPQQIMDFLDTVLQVGPSLWELISDIITRGKGVFDTILSFITNNVLEALLNKTLMATLGLTTGVADLVARGVAFVRSVVDYISSFDFTKFVEDVGEELLQTALGLLQDTIGEEFIEKMMSIIKVALSVVDLVDKFDTESLVEVLAEAAELVIGPSDIVTSAEELARGVMEVVKEYSEQGLSSVASFADEVEDVIAQNVASSVPTQVRYLVRDIVTMVAGFFNDGFNPSDVPHILDILEALAQQLLLVGGGYSLSDAQDVIDALRGAVRPVLAIAAMVSDSTPLKEIVCGTVGQFNSDFPSVATALVQVVEFLDTDHILSGVGNAEEVLGTFGEIVSGIVSLVNTVKDQSFEGILNTLLMAVGSIVGTFPSFDDVPITAMLELLQSFFPRAFGLDPSNLPSPAQVVSKIVDMAAPLLKGIVDPDVLTEMLSFIMDIKGIFTDGVKWLLSRVYDWLTGQLTPLLQQLENSINSILGGAGDLLGFDGSLPIGLGEWSLFQLTVALGITANFHINPTPFFEFVRSILFEGRSPFSLSTLGEFFKVVFSFFEISPQFYAELGVEGFDTSKNSFFQFLLDFLGVQMSFSGHAKFVLTLFTFRNGQFEWEDFFKIVEWTLSIKIAIEKTMTLLDFFTGGVGGGVLAKLASLIGLDGIKVSIWFSVELEIVKKAATAVAPEVSTLTLVLTIGAAISLSLDVIIASASLYGSLEITLRFFQDLAASSPLHITLRLILTFKLKLQFLFWSWKKTWTWEPGGPWDLSPKPGDSEYDKSAVGVDSDGDGLSDEYEATIPGLDPKKPDTDDDGANDKLEVQTMGTDPVDPDSDDDGLLDGEEWDLGTNPMRPDSDWDDLTDYEEVKVYGTNPLTQDTDGDGLTDAYEIRTPVDLSGVTPTVTEVIIGGVAYNDRTDPLNPDTDGDGLLDGDEGPTGAYYGLDDLYNDTEGSGFDPQPLIFNGGYTHPLDADTDDDSYLQLYNGAIDTQALTFLKDMSDGAEVAGFWIVVYDSEGEPENKQVFTNPCNPDTDGDTGVTDRTPQPGLWLNSDGYELAQTPPTDPTDGDSDDDGLIDGLEGVLNPLSNHTNPNDPDTDDDGLFDMQEVLLGCDPRAQDTDGDMVSDGDEFYRFFTNPNVADTDMDGLLDGEEVFIWHTNPLIDDSDADGLLDGQEVLVYGSDPMDEDGDNDGLTDFQEIMVYYTNAFDYDSDDDGLSDGEEILTYHTNPLAWDTDMDSITEPDASGNMTWPMSDYQEIMYYNTNASDPDSDLDGLSDAIELYLGSGEIPWMDPIPLDPTSNDTDNDLLLDGAELVLRNISDITYPYVAVYPVLRYNTSPVVADTDNDTLTDYQEVMVFNTDPTTSDTDNDTLPDWWEVWVYNTSALYNDTDGDGLLDNEETLTEVWPYGPWPPTNWSTGMAWLTRPEEGVSAVSGPSRGMADGYVLSQSPLYPCSATDPDSDDDWLSDGAEVLVYGSNPMSPDTDGDGVLDTYEYDTDGDGLPDGVENQLGLYWLPDGGIENPDSDADGLSDGEEYYLHGTDPALVDTDGDGYSDGLEVAIGTDPLTWTSPEEFQWALALTRGTESMRVMMPRATVVNSPNVPVTVANFTPFTSMWFRYNTSDGWSNNYTLSYDHATGMWSNDEVTWEDGAHRIQVFANDSSGNLHVVDVTFLTGLQPGQPSLSTTALLIGVGAAIGALALGIIGFVAVPRLKRRREEGGAGEGPEEGGEEGPGGGDGTGGEEEAAEEPSPPPARKKKKTGTGASGSKKKTRRRSTGKKKASSPEKGNEGGE